MVQKKALSFISLAIMLFTLFVLFTTPLVKKDLDTTVSALCKNSGKDFILIPEKPFKPSIYDQIFIRLKASNTKGSDYQKISGVIKAGDLDYHISIYIDSFSHGYYIYPGLEEGYPGQESIEKLYFSLPQLHCIEYEVEKINLSRRVFYPVDIKAVSFVVSLFSLDELSMVLMSFYMAVFLAILLFIAFYFIFRPKKAITKIISISLISMALAYSVWFFARSIFITKSYYYSYADDIALGRPDLSYEGFYGFERFIKWVDTSIPRSKDLVVFTRGEPVYLKSELAYNLYPRDIDFMDIAGNDRQIIAERLAKNAAKGRYLILLSSGDRPYLKSITNSGLLNAELVSKYKEDAGFIYRLLP